MEFFSHFIFFEMTLTGRIFPLKDPEFIYLISIPEIIVVILLFNTTNKDPKTCLKNFLFFSSKLEKNVYDFWLLKG